MVGVGSCVAGHSSWISLFLVSTTPLVLFTPNCLMIWNLVKSRQVGEETVISILFGPKSGFRWLRTIRKWRNDMEWYTRLVLYSVLLLQLLKRLRFVIRLNIRLSCFNNSGERWMCRGYFSRILIAIFHHFKSAAREKSSRCFQFYSTLWLWHLANRSTCIYMKLVYICVYIWSSTIYFRSGQN